RSALPLRRPPHHAEFLEWFATHRTRGVRTSHTTHLIALVRRAENAFPTLKPDNVRPSLFEKSNHARGLPRISGEGSVKSSRMKTGVALLLFLVAGEARAWAQIKPQLSPMTIPAHAECDPVFLYSPTPDLSGLNLPKPEAGSAQPDPSKPKA